MFRVNGKIERLLRFDPLDAKWQWAALSFLPCRTPGRWRRHGMGRAGGVGAHFEVRIVDRCLFFHPHPLAWEMISESSSHLRGPLVRCRMLQHSTSAWNSPSNPAAIEKPERIACLLEPANASSHRHGQARSCELHFPT